MSSSILYYPTIEFKREDYNWLWNASLFWDKIYRIVPPGYNLTEPANIKELCSTGEIGIPISPLKYASKASEDFLDFIEENQYKAAALSFVDNDEAELIRIHSSKIDERLQNEIFYKLKDISQDDNWLYANPHTVNFYMTFLANHIAQKNSLSLYTGNQDLWTTSTYYLCNGNLQDGFFPGKEYIEPSTEALISIILPDIYPQNILDYSPETLLDFRERRKDERHQFQIAIEHLKNEIEKADAPEVLNIILNDEKDKVKSALTEYKKSMDLLKAVKFGGALTTVATIAADAIGYLPDIPKITKGIIGSSGVWLSVLTGILENKRKSTHNPYTYLAHINSAFSLYPNTTNVLAGKPFWDMYSYSLYRGFEEFIND